MEDQDPSSIDAFKKDKLTASSYPREFLCCLFDITPYSWNLCEENYSICFPAVCSAISNHVMLHLTKSPLNFLILDLIHPFGVERIFANLSLENNMLQADTSKTITSNTIYEKIEVSVQNVYKKYYTEKLKIMLPNNYTKTNDKNILINNSDNYVIDKTGRCPEIGTAFTSVLCYLNKIRQNDSVLKNMTVRILIINASPLSHAQKLLFITSMFAARKGNYTVNVLSFEKQLSQELNQDLTKTQGKTNSITALPIFKQACVILNGCCLDIFEQYSYFVDKLKLTIATNNESEFYDGKIDTTNTVEEYIFNDYIGISEMLRDFIPTATNIENENILPTEIVTNDITYNDNKNQIINEDKIDDSNTLDLEKIKKEIIDKIDPIALNEMTINFIQTFLQLVDPPKHLSDKTSRIKIMPNENNIDTTVNEEKETTVDFYGYCSSCGKSYEESIKKNSFSESTWFTCSACLAVYCPKCTTKNTNSCIVCATILEEAKEKINNTNIKRIELNSEIIEKPKKEKSKKDKKNYN